MPNGVSISVAMTTYQGARFLREQLASILDQSVAADEIVISDDASTDDTWAILEAFASTSDVPVRLLRQENNVGLRANIETVLSACHGTIVVLADQDDVWRPGKLAAVNSAFRDPDVMLWFSDAALVGSDGRDLGASAWESLGFRAEDRALVKAGRGLRLLHGATVTGATMAVRSEVISMALPLPAAVGGPGDVYLHDGWLAVLASIRGSVALDETEYVAYRQHPAQFTGRSMQRLAQASAPEPPGLWNIESLSGRHPQLLVDVVRVRLVLSRVRDSGALSLCRGDAVRELLDLEAFFEVRMLPRGNARRRRALAQLVRGRYSRYARGFRTALKDLA